jgi:hypothetical protein
MKRLTAREAKLLSAGLLAPLWLPLPGVAAVLVIYPEEKAHATIAGIYSLALGIGAIGWTGLIGFVVAVLLSIRKAARFVFWPLFALAISLGVAALPTVLTLGRASLYGGAISGYWLCGAFGFLAGASVSEKDKKMKRRMAWMKD